MMLPTLISVSVAPGSYFFCACAVPASAVASSAASAIFVRLFLASSWTRSRIIVLPDVLGRWLVQSSLVGLLGEPSDRMHTQYARLGTGGQQPLCCYFPSGGSGSSRRAAQQLSNMASAEDAPWRTFRSKALIHESCAKGAVVHRKPSRGPAYAR